MRRRKNIRESKTRRRKKASQYADAIATSIKQSRGRNRATGRRKRAHKSFFGSIIESAGGKKGHERLRVAY